MVSLTHGLPAPLLSTDLLLSIALPTSSGWSLCFVIMFTLQRKAVPSWHCHSRVTSLACALVCPGWGPLCLGLLSVLENTWPGSVRSST